MSNSSTAIPTQSVPTPTQALDQNEQEQLALIHALVVTAHHFFGSFAQLFHPIHDPRVPYLITYPLDTMCFAGTLMFLCRLGARRQINNLFRSNGPSGAKFQSLIERGSLFRKAFPAGVGSAKNIAFRLLEAWRNLRLRPDDIQQMLSVRLQIRFVPP